MKKTNFLFVLLLFGLHSMAQSEYSVKIDYNVRKINSNEFEISIIFNLPDSVKIISPLSPDSAYDKTMIVFQRNPDISFSNLLTESPEYKKEFIPIEGKEVYYNQGIVKFTRILKITSVNEFSSEGFIQIWFLRDKNYIFPQYEKFRLSYKRHSLTISKII